MRESKEYRQEDNLHEKLSAEEARDICQSLNDDRVRVDEDIEHFTVHTEGKVTYVPKRRTITITNESGAISYVKIEHYLQQLLSSL